MSLTQQEKTERTAYRIDMVRKEFSRSYPRTVSARKWKFWRLECRELLNWLVLIRIDGCITGEAGERLDNVIAALKNTGSDYSRRFKKLHTETLELFKIYESTL